MSNPRPLVPPRAHMRQIHLIHRSDELKQAAIAECIELYESGLTLTEVSEATSVKRDTIYRWLKNRKLIRTRAESLAISWELHRRGVKPRRESPPRPST